MTTLTQSTTPGLDNDAQPTAGAWTADVAYGTGDAVFATTRPRP